MAHSLSLGNVGLFSVSPASEISRMMRYQQFLQTRALSIVSRTFCHGLNSRPQCGQELMIVREPEFAIPLSSPFSSTALLRFQDDALVLRSVDLGYNGFRQTDMAYKFSFLNNGIAAQPLPVHKAKVGETVQFHVINLGEQIHSFHLHGHKMISSTNDRGSVITHQTIPLVQGTLETFIVNPDKPGLWLFHCHVVGHADAGMIGLFIVEE